MSVATAASWGAGGQSTTRGLATRHCRTFGAAQGSARTKASARRRNVGSSVPANASQSASASAAPVANRSSAAVAARGVLVTRTRGYTTRLPPDQLVIGDTK